MRRVVSAVMGMAVLGFPARYGADGLEVPSVAARGVATGRGAGSTTRGEAIGLTPFERAVGARMRGLDAVMVEVQMRTEAGVVGHGSGVFVSATGDVLTAAHVVADAKHSFRVVLSDGSARDARVVARDATHDAALLRAPGKAPTPFAQAIAGPPARGGWVVCAGYGGDVAAERAPMRGAGLVADTFVWSVTEYEAGRHLPIPKKTSTFGGMVRTDCATAPGMSGGPVVDLAGGLVGVVVGSGGVISPVSGFRHLLPPKSTPVVSERVASPQPIAGADGQPSRDAAVAPEFSLPKGALVELALPSAELGVAPFVGVIVSGDGLVVAPSVRLRKAGQSDEPVSANDIVVSGEPNAHCTEVVALRGELALLRFTGLLDDRSHHPIGPAGGTAVGELVAAINPGDGLSTFGFVTDELRHPGRVAPDGPRWGCGLVHATFARAHPPIQVGAALATDAGWSRFGSLLVDRRGRPIGIDVASRAPGLSFAVPWAEVLERFHPWLSDGDG